LSVEQEKQVVYIQRSATELTELVNDLLDLAKVEAGKTDIKPKHFEVQDVFGALRGMLKPLLTGNSLELIFDADPALPPLYTDEGKVSQILRNLISNALKFTRRGHVRLSAQLEADGLIVFRVSDTGIGIAPEDQERIFEEFVQIESELQAKVKGTGLGLPLSRRLAELLGGTITLESELGIGSTFSVILPISFGRPEPTHVVQAPHAQSTGPTILFIEDNQDTSFVHESALRASSYRLLFAANIPEARAAMRESTPAVIALDRFIDGEDALFYIKELKEQGYGGPIAVISVIDEPQAALGAGADVFLAKPVAPFILANTLRELIEGRTSRTVLLVDDDEVTRYVLGEALAKMGYSIVEARNGREAIRIMENNIPTGMFLDIVMPDLTGFEVLREMRLDPSTKDIPVVIHSSKELSAQEVEYLSSMGAVIFPKREFGGDSGTQKLREILATVGIG